MVKGHPKGLTFLFFTEFWERFGYYLMIGILTLYMMDTVKGGLEMDKKQAYDIFGTFIALVYLTPFIGGMIADRILGYRYSIIIGSTLMGFGYLGLAIPGMTAFYVSLTLIIVGTGFFKSSMATLLGNLYNSDEYKDQKDNGYSIFYMGINLGAFICNFVAAYMRNKYGWGYAFGAAGIGMFIGLFTFIAGNKEYLLADVKKTPRPGEAPLWKVLSIIIIPAVIFGIVGWIIPGNIFGTDSTDAFLIGCVPIVIYFIYLYWSAPKEEKNPIGALLAIMGVVVIFWAIFKQNGTALTTWAENYTNRELPTTAVNIVEPFGMVQKLEMKKDSVPDYDALFRTQLGADKKVLKRFDYPPYFNNMSKEELPTDGQTISLLSTEIFQSINPFFIVILTPLVVGFFAWMKRRKKGLSTPWKIFYGLLISACSSFVMVVAVAVCHNGLEKSSAWWLLGTYGVITIGELFLSPMGLSLVSKMAPIRIAALMMGAWSLSTSIGNKLSGVLASMWDGYEDKKIFFVVNSGLLLVAAIGILLMLPWLKKVIAEKEGNS
jgi:POT family proton-dependent oligopeptide transporter